MLARRPRRGKRPKRLSQKKNEKEQAAQNVCLREFLILNYEFVYSSRKLHIIIIFTMEQTILIIISLKSIFKKQNS